MRPVRRWEVRAVPLPGTGPINARFTEMVNEHPARFFTRTMAARAADRDEDIIGSLVRFDVVDRWAR